jgi:hypothetical protein
VLTAGCLLLLAGTGFGSTKKKHKPSDADPTATDAPAAPPKAQPVTDEEAKAGNNGAPRAPGDVRTEEGAGGVLSYWFASGDDLSAKNSPDLKGHGLDIEAQFLFDPKTDSDATLADQGGPQLGWAIHFIAGKPAVTINYEGLHTTLCAAEALPAGRVLLRVLLGLDGTLALSATGLKTAARGYAPMTGGFPRKPEEGLAIGHSFGPLSHEAFPQSTSYSSEITFVRLSLLPAKPVGLAAK